MERMVAPGPATLDGKRPSHRTTSPPSPPPPSPAPPPDFPPRHVHSEFSLLDGLGRITELVDSAAQQGFDSLALTDHGALYGSVGFYQACANKGIKPIIGVETYVA